MESKQLYATENTEKDYKRVINMVDYIGVVLHNERFEDCVMALSILLVELVRKGTITCLDSKDELWEFFQCMERAYDIIENSRNQQKDSQ